MDVLSLLANIMKRGIGADIIDQVADKVFGFLSSTAADTTTEERGVTSENADLLPAILGCLLCVVECADTEVKGELGQLGIFDCLFGFYTLSYTLDLLKDASLGVEIWSTTFLICASLCRGCRKNKQIVGRVEKGVEVIISFLGFTSPDSREQEFMLLTVTDCIWSCICGNLDTEETFFALDGVFSLLDLLEAAGTDKQRRNLLNCLLDLLENPKTRFHVYEWRRKLGGGEGSPESSDRLGIQHYLIEIWNEQEKLVGAAVQDDNKYVLGTVHSPLVGTDNFKDADVNRFEFDGLVINEISLNLRVYHPRLTSRLKSTLHSIVLDSLPSVLHSHTRNKQRSNSSRII
jgi:hypothetical protein